MTFLQAAEEVLRSTKRPLSAREITELALQRGLIQSVGKTPAATMRAALYKAPASGSIQREFRRGRARAARGSVRWFYSGAGRAAALASLSHAT